MRGAWLSFEDKLGACLRVQLIRTLTASNTAGVVESLTCPLLIFMLNPNLKMQDCMICNTVCAGTLSITIPQH